MSCSCDCSILLANPLTLLILLEVFELVTSGLSDLTILGRTSDPSVVPCNLAVFNSLDQIDLVGSFQVPVDIVAELATVASPLVSPVIVPILAPCDSEVSSN